jgi:hypothetical protein
MRAFFHAAAIASALVACGGPSAAAPTALGVQSNASTERVTLRHRPAIPTTFATRVGMRLESEMIGQPMTASLETRGVRRVLERRPDGALAIEELDTSTRYEMTMMGTHRSGPEPTTPHEPRRYLLGERGRRIDEPAASPTAPPGAPAGPGSPEDMIADRVEGMLDPLLRAMEYPEQSIGIGEEWGANGRIPLAQIEPSIEGEALYRITQRVERLEGSGDARVAILSFDGSIEATGRPSPTAPPPQGGPLGGAPGAPAGISGSIRFRGFYAVALSDGFARTARAEIDGEVRLGPEEMMRFPLRGEMRWEAEPISSSPITAPTITAPTILPPTTP